MPGYKDWIDSIEIKVDYFSAFLKAWIAFNAWYNFSGEVTGRNDKECIEFIGSRSNRFKTQIENLLIAESTEGNTFRDNLASLHTALLRAAITTQEYIGVRQAVSFAEVAVKNSNANDHFQFRSVKYECSRSHGQITTVITNIQSGIQLLSYTQDEYDLDQLKQQSTFLRLTPERQSKCIVCYEKLKPYIVSSVLANDDHKIVIGIYNFINDTSKISQAIVTILYMLRCCLAHGEVSPDETANNVYRYAYEVLAAPLKKLK